MPIPIQIHTLLHCFSLQRPVRFLAAKAAAVRAVAALAGGLLCLSLVCLSLVRDAHAQRREKPKFENAFALVEYFTSDNCIRCREATDVAKSIDALATDSGKHIYLVSFHVDYLNTEVWKDRLGTVEFSDRQKAYARQFKQRKVVPGAMVINARHYVEGTKPNDIQRAIAEELKRKPVATVTPFFTRGSEPGSVVIEYKIKGIQKMRRPFFNVGLALVEPVTHQLVASGNNAGVSLRHVNSVQMLEMQRVDAQGLGSAELQVPDSMRMDDLFAIVFVQDPQGGAILGVGRAGLDGATVGAPKAGSAAAPPKAAEQDLPDPAE